MQRKTSLFVLAADIGDEAVTAAAEAAQREDAHLACLLLDNLPSRPYFAYSATGFGAAAMPADWVDRLRDARQAAETRSAEVNALLARSRCSGGVQYAVCAGADIRMLCAQRAKTCDIAQFADGLRSHEDVFHEALHGLLFQSPVPVIMNGTPFAGYSRVFLAWDSSLAASRAAHAALPYLCRAQEVVIGCFETGAMGERGDEDPGADAAAWLSHHGCNVTVSQFPGGGCDVGHGIQQRAREAGADLVVMGAYGHSRLREAVFGGTTRTMVGQTDLPVLLAH
ncbi:universal stress protein [Leisingera sp. ANG-Vp]|uniref:universal stress protein n=1 Tax=Leisingera sp. ANG-Vp TaxID=1577896 RepID=UPI00057F7FFC|nr:universal stress protein [Leisingera sp. ANG-Vp]KIC15219.1 universal stress protein UspA [Leisingera sp. ANG-Vp]